MACLLGRWPGEGAEGPWQSGTREAGGQSSEGSALTAEGGQARMGSPWTGHRAQSALWCSCGMGDEVPSACSSALFLRRGHVRGLFPLGVLDGPRLRDGAVRCSALLPYSGPLVGEAPFLRQPPTDSEHPDVGHGKRTACRASEGLSSLPATF